MGERTPEPISADSANTTDDTLPAPEMLASTPASPEDVASVITELEQYRARLVDDFTTTAKKAKLPKSMTMAQLKEHPEILKIDTALAQLRGETSPDNNDA